MAYAVGVWCFKERDCGERWVECPEKTFPDVAR